MTEKPDVKKIGLDMSEDLLNSAMDKIIKPYAAYYVAKEVPGAAAMITPFIEKLTEYLKRDVIDKIDGEDDIK